MISRRRLIGGATAVALLGRDKADAAFWQGQASSSVVSPQWYALPVGGGGAQSKLAIHPSGVIFSGADTAWIGSSSTVIGTPNTQLQTASSMPASFLPTPYISGDAYDLAIGANVNTFYWYWACAGENIATLLKSTNQGANWATTGFPITNSNGNGNLHRVIWQMIAEDPANSNVVYVGGYDALRRTLDGCATFSSVSGITAPGTDPGVCAIQFDPTSGTTTLSGVTVTAKILLSVYGSGVYVSTNGGASFSLIPGSPTGVTSSCMGTDGNYYAVSYGVTPIVRISTANALTTISCNIGVSLLALNPHNPAQAIAWDPTGGSCVTFDGPINGATAPTGTHNGGGAGISIVSPDVPWLELTGDPSGGPMLWDPFITTSTTSLTIGTGSKTLTVATGQNLVVGDAIRVSNTGTLTNYMRGLVTAYNSTTGSLTFTVGNDDPSQYLCAQTGGSGTFFAWQVTKDRQHYCTGVGRLYIDAASYAGAQTYNSQTFGIETLSSCTVLWPPGYAPQLSASDFPFRTQTTNPVGQTIGNASYQPTEAYSSIADGNFMCYAVSDPSTLFAISVRWIGKSTNQGASWTALASAPSLLTSGIGAWIAASTPSNIVVASQANAAYTTDGGATWLTPTGMPSIDQGPYALAGSPIIADSVTPNKFYCIDDATGAVYVSTNSGATWAATGGSVTLYPIVPNLVAVPGHAGHLLYASGEQSGNGSTPAAIVASSPTPFNGQLQFSSDSGVTWTTLPSLQETICVACGAAKPGGNGYPSFAFAGWVSDVYGLWRVDNFDPTNISATTYNNIGTFPTSTIDFPDSIAGDSTTWNRWILSQRNSGWRYYGTASGWAMLEPRANIRFGSNIIRFPTKRKHQQSDALVA